MNGFTPIGQANVSANPGLAFGIADPGDFNGDHHADIAFQNIDGQSAVWLMNGFTPIAQANVSSNPGADWHLV